MTAYGLIFLGGGLGSVLRYALGRWLPVWLPATAFPAGVLVANVLASLVLGGLTGWATGRASAEPARWLLGVGLCGGLSTFSGFSQDTLLLLQQGRGGAALLNIVLNTLGCLLASALGWWLLTRPPFSV